MAIRPMTTRVAPTAMPAIAPVARGSEEESVEGSGVVVEVDVGVDVTGGRSSLRWMS